MSTQPLAYFPVHFFNLEKDADNWLYKFHKALDAFVSRNLPDHDFSMKKLTEMIGSLIQNQRIGNDIMKGGSWALLDTKKCAPSDIRVQYFFFPSYMVVAFLTTFHYRCREQAGRIEGFYSALHRGIQYITYRGLTGHGIEGELERNEALKILLKGRVHLYTMQYRDSVNACMNLYKILTDIKTSFINSGPISALEKEILQTLNSYPQLYLRECKYFDWCPAKVQVPILLETPCTRSFGRTRQCGAIVINVAVRHRTAVIIGKAGGENFWPPGKHNQFVVDEYLKIIKEIAVNTEQGPGSVPFLHLIIRDADDINKNDIELNSGGSCSGVIVNMIYNHFLQAPLTLYRRKYNIIIGQLFGACNEHPQFTYFGSKYNVIVIRLSHDMLIMEQARVTDTIGAICEDFISFCKM